MNIRQTEQARKDLERLALIKKKRAEDAAKREKAGRKPGMSAYGLPEQDDNNADEGDSSGSSSEDDGEVISFNEYEPNIEDKFYLK